MNLRESCICVSMCYGLLVVVNRQGVLTKFLSDNAFGAFVFHPPIVVLAARMLDGITAPAILRFLILTSIGLVLHFERSCFS